MIVILKEFLQDVEHVEVPIQNASQAVIYMMIKQKRMSKSKALNREKVEGFLFCPLSRIDRAAILWKPNMTKKAKAAHSDQTNK